MTKYAVVITRPITESTTIFVSARSREQAEDAAMAALWNLESADWEVDEGSWNTDDGEYVSSVEEVG
jgi:hypothetical protein